VVAVSLPYSAEKYPYPFKKNANTTYNLGRLKQEDRKFKASLGYIVYLRPA
jgi:hypothetical protein